MADALSYLREVVAALAAVRLEAVLIGAGAAALQGAPVMTRDMDFLIRPTKTNEAKLQQLAKRLGGHLSQPYEGVSTMRRISRGGLQLDFLTHMNAIRSFEGLRRRSVRAAIGSGLRVAALEDVIRSKRSAGRPKDRAVLPVLERTLRERAAKK